MLACTISISPLTSARIAINSSTALLRFVSPPNLRFRADLLDSTQESDSPEARVEQAAPCFADAEGELFGAAGSAPTTMLDAILYAATRSRVQTSRSFFRTARGGRLLIAQLFALRVEGGCSNRQCEILKQEG